MRESRDHPTTSLIYRASLARMTWNMAVGTLLFGLFILFHPSVPPLRALPTLLAALVAFGGWRWLAVRGFSPSPPEICHLRIFRKPLAVILIGASLVAFIWSTQKIPWIILPVTLGFFARWILYFCEIQDIRVCDLRKIGLPPFAMRLRLWITLITGAVIPGLVLLGLPAPPLLLLSLLLTCFTQWSVTCEIELNVPLPATAGR